MLTRDLETWRGRQADKQATGLSKEDWEAIRKKFNSGGDMEIVYVLRPMEEDEEFLYEFSEIPTAIAEDITLTETNDVAFIGM